MSKRFDPAYKMEVCKSIASGHATVVEMAQETGIHENTVFVKLNMAQKVKKTG